MSWQNSWPPPHGMAPGYPPPMPGPYSVPAAAPIPSYGAVNPDQYNQWQWQQYQQQYAQWYAMYGEKYAQQTGNALPPVASPMPQVLPNATNNAYIAPPLPVGPAFGAMNMTAPPPPSEPHPDELKMRTNGERPPLPEEKSPEEIAFDEQFRKWEQEFETWKRTNINHPDKVAYREYEQKYEEQRKKLLDHREQLRRRRIEQSVGPRAHATRGAVPVTSLQSPPPPPPSQAPQPPPQPPQPNLENSSISNRKNVPVEALANPNTDGDNAANNMQLQNLFSPSGNSGRGSGIPGLDLIDENPAPLPKKAKLEDNVIDLAGDEKNAKPAVTKANPNNMISSLLNDPNVNALLQLVGKTIGGGGTGAGGATNPLVAALAQLSNNSNTGNLNQEMPPNFVERSLPNGLAGSNEDGSSRSPSMCSLTNNGPNNPVPLPSSSNTTNEDNCGRNTVQAFNPRVPPPPLDVDLTRPPPFIRPMGKSQHDRWGRNSEPASENGSYNDRGYQGDGSPVAKIPRFDRPPPSLATGEKEYDPELGRPVAVPKPDWMTEDEYQEIYDRYEHVQSFDERKHKMELAIQVLKQNKTRAGRLPSDEPNAAMLRTHGGMPKPLPPVKPEIKREPTDDFFQPQQVFDYSNCSNPGTTVASHSMPAGRVIDYGHRGASQYSSNNRFNNNNNSNIRQDGFRGRMHNHLNAARAGHDNGFVGNTQRFDYNHSRVVNATPSVPLQQAGQNWPQPNPHAPFDRSVTGLERLAQMHLNPNPEESNPNYPSKFLLMNDNRPNCLSTKRGKRPSSIRKQKLKQQQSQEQQPQGQNVPPSDTVVCKQEPELVLEELSSEEDPVDDGVCQSNDEGAQQAIKQEEMDERPGSTISSVSSQNLSISRMIEIDDLLLPPGRFGRPARICFLIRGLPGSGKSHLARLIKNKEQSFGPSPRVLSLDDYFLVDKEEEVKDPVSGKVTKVTRSQYEYDGEMEDIYIQNLIKAFKRTISERLFNFVIVDCCNHRLETYLEFHNYARSNGFKVYTCTMQTDVDECTRQNVHKRTEAEIQAYADSWAMAPDDHLQVNFNTLLEPEQQEDTDTMVADMELAAPDEEDTFAEEDPDTQSDHDNASHTNSNDETAEARLDGTSKPLKRPPTLEDYLQLDDVSDGETECRDDANAARKKKRVRWADVEERKAQQKMRQVGFVVGVTDWKRMLDPTEGSSALTQTKYIARVKKQP
uniref:YLP motif-containing protein 1 n=1 Tax=Anopheles dirus TaxID=7168 RepID=A0A182NQX4_9DIPT